MIDTPRLVGREVTLRALVASDVEPLARAAAESREHYRLSPVPEGSEGTARYVAQALQQRETGFRMPFTVLWNDRVVGSTSYSELTPWSWPEGSPHVRHDRPDSVEIGYTWYAASAQRTRVNTEAKYLLMRHAFEVWQVHSVTWRTDQRNERSRRAIERLGATYDGTRRAHCAGADDTVRSSAFYSMLPTEWPTARAALEAKLA